MLNNLGDARELIAMLPALKQADGHWQYAADLLTRASIAPSAKDEALAAVVLRPEVRRIDLAANAADVVVRVPAAPSKMSRPGPARPEMTFFGKIGKGAYNLRQMT